VSGVEPAVGRGRAAAWSAALVPLLGAAIAYLPITRGYFLSDDFIHLYRRVNDPFLVFVLHPAGGHVLMGWNLAIAATHALFGTEAAAYFWVVLLAHLVAVGLLFRTAVRLTASLWIAAVVALAWGTAPMQLGTLGWLSVSGQVLATVLLLAVLASMARVANGEATLGARPWWWAGASFYAATCFGMALATVIVTPFYAWLTLGPRDRRCAFLVLAPLVAAVPAVYVLDHWVWARLTAFPIGDSVAALEKITAPRIVEMLALLVTQGLAGLLGGPLARRWAPGALMGFQAVASVVALGALALGSPRERRRVVGLLLLAVAAYGAIAAGRADFYAKLFGDDALSLGRVAVDRYQYLASALLALAVGSIAGIVVRRVRSTTSARAWVPAWSGPLVLGGVVLWTAAAPRDADFARNAAQREQRTNAVLGVMRGDIVATPPGGLAVLRNRSFGPAGVAMPPWAFPGWAGAFVVFHPRNEVAGRRVLFVDPRPEVLDATRNGRRTAGLIVAAPPGVSSPPAGQAQRSRTSSRSDSSSSATAGSPARLCSSAGSSSSR
jgi:hypothetical protein